MGELYQQMERDLKLRNFSELTQRHYLRCTSDFVRFYMKSPRQLGVPECKAFLAHLLSRGKSPETLKLHVASLKFLYRVTLKRHDEAEELPWPKVPHRQPAILSGTEIERVLTAAKPIVPATVLMAAYGAGLRISEACQLRVEDIDARRGLLHVRQGKGRRTDKSCSRLGCSSGCENAGQRCGRVRVGSFRGREAEHSKLAWRGKRFIEPRQRKFALQNGLDALAEPSSRSFYVVTRCHGASRRV